MYRNNTVKKTPFVPVFLESLISIIPNQLSASHTGCIILIRLPRPGYRPGCCHIPGSGSSKNLENTFSPYYTLIIPLIIRAPEFWFPSMAKGIWVVSFLHKIYNLNKKEATMKRKEFKKKFALNKTSVARLDNEVIKRVKAGGNGYCYGPNTRKTSYSKVCCASARSDC